MRSMRKYFRIFLISNMLSICLQVPKSDRSYGHGTSLTVLLVFQKGSRVYLSVICMLHYHERIMSVTYTILAIAVTR